MIINYFKIALRYLLRNRTFSVINIFGLLLIPFITISFRPVKAAVSNPVDSL
jgi:hypothetical protein